LWLMHAVLLKGGSDFLTSESYGGFVNGQQKSQPRKVGFAIFMIGRA
jgi:hypothetical protein